MSDEWNIIILNIIDGHLASIDVSLKECVSSGSGDIHKLGTKL